MVTLLLLVIYIAFIGLGLPDSVFGTAWPTLYRDLNIPVSLGGYISMFTFIWTILSSLCSAKLVKRFGTGLVTACSTVLTAAALIIYSFSQSPIWLFALAIPLGFGAGAIDSVLNNFVALHFNARVMSFLHCFYGVGIAMSPYIMSFSLKNGDWRGGYRTAFAVQAVIALITLVALPLWKRFDDRSTDEDTTEQKSLKPLEIIKKPGYFPAALTFMFSCAVEGICTQWANTFLVDSRGIAAGTAARIIVFYYCGIALGRFISGVLANRFSSWQITFAGCAMFIPASLLLNFGSGNILVGIGLFCIGFGNGPLFPNLVHITPSSFGAENSQAMMGAQLALAYSGLMVFPPFFGSVLGASAFPWFVTILFVCITLMAVLYYRKTRKNG